MATDCSLRNCLGEDLSHTGEKRNRTDLSNSYLTNAHHAVQVCALAAFKNTFWADAAPYKRRRKDLHQKE